MAYRIVDTNVPLTAAGKNHQASDACAHTCGQVMSRILKGELRVVIDDFGSAIAEYRRRMYPDPQGTLAAQFLMYLLLNQYQASRIHRVRLELTADGMYHDFPDLEDAWSTAVERCERFDPDDKKWVSLAARFKQDTGHDAPIVHAADRCWLAFQSHLEAAGIQLEALCQDERGNSSTPKPTDAPG